MRPIAVTHADGPADTEAMLAMVVHVGQQRGDRPLSDQSWIGLHEPISNDVVRRRADVGDRLLGFAQATADRTDGAAVWTMELCVGHDDDTVLVATPLIRAIITAIEADGGGTLVWLVFGPDERHEQVAAALGLALSRQLHQMTRPLPTGLAFHVTTRSFDPARDIDEWVRVNARAFAWSPDQGHWTAAEVRARMAEPWFDADGFLIHERDGRMAGFCWTKVHAATQPPMGEIYVIAADPDFHGQGLGRDLTLAGLDSLARQGLTVGMLFVDATNTAAIALYDKLGFTVSRTDSNFSRMVDAT